MYSVKSASSGAVALIDWQSVAYSIYFLVPHIYICFMIVAEEIHTDREQEEILLFDNNELILNDKVFCQELLILYSTSIDDFVVALEGFGK